MLVVKVFIHNILYYNHKNQLEIRFHDSKMPCMSRNHYSAVRCRWYMKHDKEHMNFPHYHRNMEDMGNSWLFVVSCRLCSKKCHKMYIYH
jgi:hypothetical protein